MRTKLARYLFAVATLALGSALAGCRQSSTKPLKLAFVTNNTSSFWQIASGVHKYEQKGRGVSQTVVQGATLSLGASPLVQLANGGVFSIDGDPLIPYPALIFLAAIAVGTYLLHFTVLGRYLYAIGGNRDAAKYSGIDVKQVETLAYEQWHQHVPNPVPGSGRRTASVAPRPQLELHHRGRRYLPSRGAGPSGAHRSSGAAGARSAARALVR